MVPKSGKDRATLACLMLRDLACRGWGVDELMERIGGINRSTLTQIRSAQRRAVLTSTYRVIAFTYRALHAQRNTQHGGTLTAKFAQRSGWAGSGELLELLLEYHPDGNNLPDIVLHL